MATNNTIAMKEIDDLMYVQICFSEPPWKLFDWLTAKIFGENWMIDDHYQGELRNHDLFSYAKDDVRLKIVIADNRAHIIIEEFTDNASLKEKVLEDYPFSNSKKTNEGSDQER